MPYLRFSRDQRGYENTYVLHTYRRDGRTLPRLLYWFRTPPSLKVGRHALDADAIRAIEESNPDLAFDWTKMLKVRPATILEERRRRTSSKAGTAKRGRRGPARKEPVSASATAGSVLSETPDSRVAEVVPDEAVSTVVGTGRSGIGPGDARGCGSRGVGSGPRSVSRGRRRRD